MAEIYQVHQRALFTGQLIEVRCGVFCEKLVYGFVGLEKPDTRLGYNFTYNIVNLFVSKPGAAVISQVDTLERVTELLGENGLLEMLAFAYCRVLRDTMKRGDILAIDTFFFCSYGIFSTGKFRTIM